MKVKLLKKWKAFVRQRYFISLLRSSFSSFKQVIQKILEPDSCCSAKLPLRDSIQNFFTAFSILLFEKRIIIELSPLKVRIGNFSKSHYNFCWCKALEDLKMDKPERLGSMYGALSGPHFANFVKKYEKHSRRYWTSSAKLHRAILSGSIL